MVVIKISIHLSEFFGFKNYVVTNYVRCKSEPLFGSYRDGSVNYFLERLLVFKLHTCATVANALEKSFDFA